MGVWVNGLGGEGAYPDVVVTSYLGRLAMGLVALGPGLGPEVVWCTLTGCVCATPEGRSVYMREATSSANVGMCMHVYTVNPLMSAQGAHLIFNCFMGTLIRA